MQVHAALDVEEYARAVTTFLEASPCSRNVLRWIIELARNEAGGWDAAPLFTWVTDGDTVAGAASWSPPFAVQLSDVPAPAAHEVACAIDEHARSVRRPVRGVSGTVAPCTALAEAWRELTGQRWQREMSETLYELDHVNETAAPAGSRRPATASDVDLICDWLGAFVAETGVAASTDTRGMVTRWVRSGECDVWVDGGPPVSFTGHRHPIAGVVRVGPVYTPPEHRNRGYARRLVAEVSEAALRRGARRCMLYADVANPVSNSIYRQIGYLPTEERLDIVFLPGTAETVHIPDHVRNG